jgi:hypothetical protein
MAMMILPPRYVMLDTNGDPISGGKVRVYDAGTTDDRDVFTDSALSVAAANPIIADSGGVVPTRYTATGETKLVFLDASDNVLLTVDDVDGGIPAGAGALPVADGGTGATTTAAARTNLSAASQTEVTSIASDVSQLQTDVVTPFTGDSGSGGAVGVVPAPVAGDAAAGKFVHADGTWKVPIVVDYAYDSDNTVSTITAATGFDDTIPLVTEGTEILSATITPKSESHLLKVTAFVPCGVTSNHVLIAHFHVNGGNTAVFAATKEQTGVTTPISVVSITFVYAPSSTSAQTVSMRLGVHGGGTITVNGEGGSRLLGGAQAATLLIEELRG